MSHATTLRTIDDLFINTNTNTNIRTLLIQKKPFYYNVKRFFYTNKPCLYKTLLIVLFITIIESYSFICGGIIYIIYLHGLNNTDIHDKLFTNNYVFNDLLFGNIILGLTCTLFFGGLYCYNK